MTVVMLCILVEMEIQSSNDKIKITTKVESKSKFELKDIQVFCDTQELEMQLEPIMKLRELARNKVLLGTIGKDMSSVRL